jgi:hypothetical protein
MISKNPLSCQYRCFMMAINSGKYKGRVGAHPALSDPKDMGSAGPKNADPGYQPFRLAITKKNLCAA